MLALAGAALALLLWASGPARSAPLAVTIALQANGPVSAGNAITFTATTNAVLGSRYGLELRGIDLGKATRSFARPDYLDKRRCTGEPCRWSVTSGSPASFQFAAFLVDRKTGAAVAQSAVVPALWLGQPAPSGLKLLFNGRALPVVPLVGGGDNYHDFAAGKLDVEARWTGDVKPAGYYVVISMLEPSERDYAVCTSGTSCVVPVKVPLLVNQEMSWSVRMLTRKGGKLVSGFRVCLTGRA
jgi:hypothetical protein